MHARAIVFEILNAHGLTEKKSHSVSKYVFKVSQRGHQNYRSVVFI